MVANNIGFAQPSPWITSLDSANFICIQIHFKRFKIVWIKILFKFIFFFNSFCEILHQRYGILSGTAYDMYVYVKIVHGYSLLFSCSSLALTTWKAQRNFSITAPMHHKELSSFLDKCNSMFRHRTYARDRDLYETYPLYEFT